MCLHTISFLPSRSVKLLYERVVVVISLPSATSTEESQPSGRRVCFVHMLMVVADYSTSVRIFEALREKTENKTQYDAYVNELKPVREELGKFPHCFPLDPYLAPTCSHFV